MSSFTKQALLGVSATITAVVFIIFVRSGDGGGNGNAGGAVEKEESSIETPRREIESPDGRVESRGHFDSHSQARDFISGLRPNSNFQDVWDEIDKSSLDGNSKRHLFQSLVAKMGLLDQTEGAVALVKSKTGFGGFQQGLIRATFRATPLKSASEYQDLILKCDFGDRKNLSRALDGIGSKLGESRIAYGELVSYGELVDDEGSSLVKGYLGARASSFHKDGGTSRESFDEAVGAISHLLKKDLISALDSAEIILDAYSVSAFVRAQTIRDFGVDVASLKGRDELARSMMRESPELAMQFLELNGDSVQIRAALDLWLRVEPTEAGVWLSENRNQIGSKFYNQIVPTFVNASVKAGEFKTAREWMEEIGDQDIKLKVEGEIWRQEKSVIDVLVKEDPKFAIDSIVSGESDHAEFWIKDAFNQWSSTDAEKAAAWYNENRKALTPSQNQHVARAYAEQAIKSGDLDTANQWLGHVTEEKFREPLVQKIKAASGE